MVVALQTVLHAQSLDLQHIKHIFEKSTEAAEASSSAQITPLQPGDVKCIDSVSDGEEMRWIRAGFKLIAQVQLINQVHVEASIDWHQSSGNLYNGLTTPEHFMLSKLPIEGMHGFVRQPVCLPPSWL